MGAGREGSVLDRRERLRVPRGCSGRCNAQSNGHAREGWEVSGRLAELAQRMGASSHLEAQFTSVHEALRLTGTSLASNCRTKANKSRGFGGQGREGGV